MTIPTFRIVAYDTPPVKEASQIAQGLADHVTRAFGPRDERPSSILAHASDDTLAGGINGVSHWGWLYIRNLWIAERWRNQGLGQRLMDAAEALARERACAGLYLDTFDADAERFYRRCGFETFGRIADFPPGHTRRFLSKQLSD